MPKSNHQDYMRVIDDGWLMFRPIDQIASKYDVLRFTRHTYTHDSIESVCHQIRQHLEPSLISGDIRKKYPDGHQRWNRSLFGYCVPAAFSLLFLIDTEALNPMSGTDPDGEHHWWLEDLESGRRYDPTSDQYSSSELDFVYDSGKPKRLYSFQGRPQKRFLDLISRVQPDAMRYVTNDLDETNREMY